MPRWLQEQRARALAGRNNRYHPPSWFGRHVTRNLSPYVTWLFLRLGISANQASVLRFFVALAIASVFLLQQPEWWIVAALACYLTNVLDSVDGELARLRGTASPQGTYVDEFTGMAGGGVLLSGIVLGLCRMLGFHAIVPGLVAIVLLFLTRTHMHVLRSIAFEWGLPAPARESTLPRETGWVRRARKGAMYLLITPGLQYFPQLLIASVLDLLVPPFMLFGLAFNVRLLWLSLFALGLLLAAPTRAWRTVRYGISSQL